MAAVFLVGQQWIGPRSLSCMTRAQHLRIALVLALTLAMTPTVRLATAMRRAMPTAVGHSSCCVHGGR